MALIVCPRCGSGVRDGAAECGVCGAPMAAAPAAASGSTAPPTQAPTEATTATAAPAAWPAAAAAPAALAADDEPSFLRPTSEAAPQPAASPAPASVPMGGLAAGAPLAPGAPPVAAPPPIPLAGGPIGGAQSGPLGAPGPLTSPVGSAPASTLGGPAASPLGGPLTGDAAEPRPNFLQPGTPAMATASGGEIRVSLTGEVLEVPPPSPRQPGPAALGPGGARAAAPPPLPPIPTATPRGGGARSAAARPPAAPVVRGRVEPREKSGSAGAVIAVLLVLVLGGAGAGGWWWYNNRTNPKDQALKAYVATKGMDWKGLYDLAAFSPDAKSKYPDADSFAKAADNQLAAASPAMASMVKQQLNSLSEVKVGDPTVTGDKADVPTSATVSAGGMTIGLKGTAHMIKVGGVWKLDLTQATSTAAAKAIADLIGQPDFGSLAGATGGRPGNGVRGFGRRGGG